MGSGPIRRIFTLPLPDRVVRRDLALALVFGIGISAALATWLMRLALVPWIHDRVPFALLFLGIAVAAILGGWRSGLVALLIGEPLIWWSILEPRWSFSLKDSEATIAFIIGIASHAILVMTIGLYQREVRRSGVARDDLDRRREALVAELNHRVKNTLAIVQGIARQTFSVGRGLTAVESFERRLEALATAHDLLTERDWQVATIEDVVERALRPFYSEAAFTIGGPSFSVLPKTAVSLSLGLHELATNAAKYGALSVSEGHIKVQWSVGSDGSFKLKWSEHGGPPVKMPERRGFGTRMIERGLATELGGSVSITFGEQGLVCDITSDGSVASIQ